MWTWPLLMNGQVYPQWDFHFPLSNAAFISGSFGELRGSHFHSGVDFTTQGRTGLPMYAIDEGYVSRIAVSPVGFGKAIYINHPNGYTSVYAHCEWFSADIEKIVTDIQYQKKSFAIDESFTPGQMPVEKGQVIAFSGNSGSSGGPHLHFEIRETDAQKPINPHFFNLPVKDDVSPIIQAVSIYPLDANSLVNGKNTPLFLPATFHGGQYHLKGNPKITASGQIGVGIETIDYSNDSWRKCGVYSIQLQLDGKDWFRSQIDGFFFHQTRYLNSHIDYAGRRKNRNVIQKSFVDENNQLEFYTTTAERGKIFVQPGHNHHISYDVADANGNESHLAFNIEGLPGSKTPAVKAAPELLKISPDNPYFISLENYKAHFPANSFYTEVPAEFELLPNTGVGIGSHFRVLNEEIPIHNFFEVTLPIPDEAIGQTGLTGALVRNGKLSHAGGKIVGNNMLIRTREAGTYCLTTDVTPPSVRLVNVPSARNYSHRASIQLNLSDDFSGINTYECRINGEWALFEYDPKNRALTGYFKNLRIDKGSKHQLEVVVTDHTGNASTLNTEFIY
ncbi:M23 family metallopeptidase [Geofilum rubicundum]|uniref:Membrane protein n=1 Tax=Geofilum rubicundum JCM 15548 TaxID=1236989 RepID=A0A0E9M2K3_9BACT|nr:M23 family metallopeptidase [Geofilum rubicundum]GAO31611.1 membrane protein [Geofilum rubicundum JCM 15548]